MGCLSVGHISDRPGQISSLMLACLLPGSCFSLVPIWGCCEMCFGAACLCLFCRPVCCIRSFEKAIKHKHVDKLDGGGGLASVINMLYNIILFTSRVWLPIYILLIN